MNAKRQLSLSSCSWTLRERSSVWGLRSGSKQPTLAKNDSGLRWLHLPSSFTIRVPKEGKHCNTGTVSPLNKNLLKSRCLGAIWQTLHPEEGLPSGIPEKQGGCAASLLPNLIRPAGRERWRPEHLGADTLWAASAPCQMEPEFSSCPGWQQPFCHRGEQDLAWNLDLQAPSFM